MAKGRQILFSDNFDTLSVSGNKRRVTMAAWTDKKKREYDKKITFYRYVNTFLPAFLEYKWSLFSFILKS